MGLCADAEVECSCTTCACTALSYFTCIDVCICKRLPMKASGLAAAYSVLGHFMHAMSESCYGVWSGARGGRGSTNLIHSCFLNTMLEHTVSTSIHTRLYGLVLRTGVKIVGSSSTKLVQSCLSQGLTRTPNNGQADVQARGTNSRAPATGAPTRRHSQTMLHSG